MYYIHLVNDILHSSSCNSTESLPEEFQTNVTFAYIVFNVEENVTEGEPQVRKSISVSESFFCFSSRGRIGLRHSAYS